MSQAKSSNQNSNNKSKNKRFVSNNHQFKRRNPPKPFQRDNDIYVTNKSDFKAQMRKCEEILNSEKGEVFLHCIGNATSRGINLALKLREESSNAFNFEANTSTIELIDDFHPLRDDEDFSIQKRLNSCLHIRVFRVTDLIKPSTSSNSNSDKEPQKLIKI